MPVKTSGPLKFGQEGSDDIRSEYGEVNPDLGLAEYYGASVTLPDVGSPISFSDFYGAATLIIDLFIDQTANTSLEASDGGRAEEVYFPEDVTYNSAINYFNYVDTNTFDDKQESEGYRKITRSASTFYIKRTSAETPQSTDLVYSQVSSTVKETKYLSTENAGLFGWSLTNPVEYLDDPDRGNRPIWSKGTSTLIQVYTNREGEGNKNYLMIPKWNEPVTNLTQITANNIGLFGIKKETSINGVTPDNYQIYGRVNSNGSIDLFYQPLDSNGNATTSNLYTRELEDVIFIENDESPPAGYSILTTQDTWAQDGDFSFDTDSTGKVLKNRFGHMKWKWTNDVRSFPESGSTTTPRIDLVQIYSSSLNKYQLFGDLNTSDVPTQFDLNINDVYKTYFKTKKTSALTELYGLTENSIDNKKNIRSISGTASFIEDAADSYSVPGTSSTNPYVAIDNYSAVRFNPYQVMELVDPNSPGISTVMDFAGHAHGAGQRVGYRSFLGAWQVETGSTKRVNALPTGSDPERNNTRVWDLNTLEQVGLTGQEYNITWKTKQESDRDIGVPYSHPENAPSWITTHGSRLTFILRYLEKEYGIVGEFNATPNTSDYLNNCIFLAPDDSGMLSEFDTMMSDYSGDASGTSRSKRYAVIKMPAKQYGLLNGQVYETASNIDAGIRLKKTYLGYVRSVGSRKLGNKQVLTKNYRSEDYIIYDYPNYYDWWADDEYHIRNFDRGYNSITSNPYSNDTIQAVYNELKVLHKIDKHPVFMLVLNPDVTSYQITVYNSNKTKSAKVPMKYYGLYWRGPDFGRPINELRNEMTYTGIQAFPDVKAELQLMGAPYDWSGTGLYTGKDYNGLTALGESYGDFRYDEDNYRINCTGDFTVHTSLTVTNGFKQLATKYNYTLAKENYTTPGYYTYSFKQDTRNKPVYTYNQVPDETRPYVSPISSTPEFLYDDARKSKYRVSLEGETEYPTKNSWPVDASFSVGWRPQEEDSQIDDYFIEKYEVFQNFQNQNLLGIKYIKGFNISGISPESLTSNNIPAQLNLTINQGDNSEFGYDKIWRLKRVQANGNVDLGFIMPLIPAAKPTFTATISGNDTNFTIGNLDANEEYRLSWVAYQGSRIKFDGASGIKSQTYTDTFTSSNIPTIVLELGDSGNASQSYKQGVDLFLLAKATNVPITFRGDDNFEVWSVVRCFEYFRDGSSILKSNTCDFLDGVS